MSTPQTTVFSEGKPTECVLHDFITADNRRITTMDINNSSHRFSLHVKSPEEIMEIARQLMFLAQHATTITPLAIHAAQCICGSDYAKATTPKIQPLTAVFTAEKEAAIDAEMIEETASRR